MSKAAMSKDFPREFVPNLDSIEDVYQQMEGYDHEIERGDLVVIEPEDSNSRKQSVRACVDSVHRGVVYGYSIDDKGRIFALHTDICVPATRVKKVGSMKLTENRKRYFLDEETGEIFDEFKIEGENRDKEFNLGRRV